MTAALAEHLDDDDPDAVISATVRALVSAHRIDTAVLARAMGISRNSYYNRVNGEKPWHARDVARAAAFFECSVQDIHDGVVKLRRSPDTKFVIERYPGSSSDDRAPLRLVPAVPGSYEESSDRYGSSAPGCGCSEGPTVAPTAGRVHRANAA